MTTTVSVALCTFNGEAFLEEQLESYLSQTRVPDELVVRDDDSTDRTLSILRAFAARAPFPVRLIEGTQRLGYAHNFEAVAGLCTGEIIALSDQDDVWQQSKLERLEAALAGGALFAFSDALLVDSALRPLGSTIWGSLGFGAKLQRQTRIGGASSPLLRTTYVTGATCAFRANLLRLARPFSLPFWHDAWLASLAAAVGRVVPVPEALILYRQHGRNALGAPAVSSVRDHVDGAMRATSARARLDAENRRRVLALFSDVQARLRERGSLASEVDAALTARVSHARFRVNLPPMPKRLLVAGREFAEGNYARYSGGARNLVRDLLRPS